MCLLLVVAAGGLLAGRWLRWEVVLWIGHVRLFLVLPEVLWATRNKEGRCVWAEEREKGGQDPKREGMS